jgi:hypothetical protein
MTDHELFSPILQRYFAFIDDFGFQKYVTEEERYKFDFVATFQTHFDLEAADLRGMLEAALTNCNLVNTGINYAPRARILAYARDFPEETREGLRVLFDEQRGVVERIDAFCSSLDGLLARWPAAEGQTWHKYMQTRFASLLLACHRPDLYYPVKPQEYRDFARLCDHSFKMASGTSQGERYDLLASYAARLNQCLRGQPRVEQLRQAFTEGCAFQDPDLHWVTQDVIFQTAKVPKLPPVVNPVVMPIVAPLVPAQEPLPPAVNRIFHGPPGTGKTYQAWRWAKELTDNDPSRSLCVTFHQSYSYEDFVEGIRPAVNAGGHLEYKVRPGAFRQIADLAAADRGNNYVLLIDEINRGNIARIFGELITLIEPGRRTGQPDCVPVQLPYSGDPFSVPPNLYIAGTMNTADRSIALMDVALRRRFEFVEVLPDYDLPQWDEFALDELDFREMWMKLNRRIEVVVDRDHLVGHSYFLEIVKSPDPREGLHRVWYRQIVPLLQEYCYNDWAKLKLLLGPYDAAEGTGFVKQTSAQGVFPPGLEQAADYAETPLGAIHEYPPQDLPAALQEL